VHDVHVLEGVAAGDAFNAGLLHALANGYEPQHAIDYAIAASVLKLSIRGDSNFVTEAEIEAAASSAGTGMRVAR
jgi:2-dehydro-3-deoxygluconokinase